MMSQSTKFQEMYLMGFRIYQNVFIAYFEQKLCQQSNMTQFDKD